MRNKKHDIIILGSGLAGLRAAIEATRNLEVDVAIISKAQPIRSHSVCAEGGTAAVKFDEILSLENENSESNVSKMLANGEGLRVGRTGLKPVTP